ncbi:hypothetical protein EG359_02630 [Chryseobacterium joostei]|uniref:Uncharacterized protein n=1 Tax=Chryseobacterium joostei TaxID=112234 RepID=A0A1N7HYY1_9FLAO|nr:hypothetical protein [Chryseobacterium joostei]AZA98568.1 hypothetical protein EG359_02630 [Chryseobacterium joostei]SIS30033.1 hypothetical protein SAMN05421768_101835 [Chryseobacterium joostei]
MAKLKVSNPNATLKDIVKPHQFNYKLTTGEKVNGKQFSISGEELIILISDFFKKHFQINESNYEKYREFQINEYDKTIKNINEKRRKLQLQINHVSSLMENYARNFNRQNNPDELQKKVFQEDIQKYQDQIDYLQKEIGKLTVSHRNAILELDAFIGGLVKINEMYDDAEYVRKRKITLLFFSNITITSEKLLVFNTKP